jgi:hypothetical protein
VCRRRLPVYTRHDSILRPAGNARAPRNRLKYLIIIDSRGSRRRITDGHDARRIEPGRFAAD